AALWAGSLAGQAPTYRALTVGAVAQCSDGRQGFAFDKLEEGATAGVYIGNAVGDTVLVDSRQRIATTGNREGVAFSNRFRHFTGAFTELVELEHADRTVPDDSTRFLHQRGKNVRGFRADIEDQVIGFHVIHILGSGLGSRGKLLCADHIHRQWDMYLAGNAARRIQQVRLIQ